MRILKNWMCLLAVLAIAGSVAACGREKEVLNETDSAVASADDKVDDDADVEEILNETDDPDEDAPIKEDDLVVKGQETTPVETNTADSSDTPEDTVPGETVAAVQNTNSRTENTTGQASVQDSRPDATEAPAATEAAPKETAPPAAEAPTEAADLENVVAGIINLDNGISYEGTGIAVNGSVVTITGEGTYIISGTLPDGMVEVNTTLKVKLKLNGVNINNSTGPAINVTDAKRLTLTLIEGTTNTLSGGSAAADGAIFTNDTLEIKGAGTLHVNGTAEHGISSDDDIVIKNGDIHVNAVKTGMMANDDITVAGGALHVVGNTNGIKSKGTLNITGGSVWTTGGPKENKSALYCAAGFTLTGGSIYAVGCGATEPDMATSTQRALAIRFSPSLEGGSTATISSGGVSLFEAYSVNPYNTIFISTPEMADGMEFNVSANGTDYGVNTLSGIITSVTVGS